MGSLLSYSDSIVSWDWLEVVFILVLVLLFSCWFLLKLEMGLIFALAFAYNPFYTYLVLNTQGFEMGWVRAVISFLAVLIISFTVFLRQSIDPNS
ncbi:MAG: hypothetical protein ACE5GN_05350, partial [Waddliaceae bacterium]